MSLEVIMMNNLKELVEKIIQYTRTWSITETEWYWNIECIRKSDDRRNEHITWEEFEKVIREETLYDLVYRNGACLRQQMENDYEVYEEDDEFWKKSSVELELAVREVIADFKVSRLDNNCKTYFI